jgi:hypothetical protein
VLGADRRHPAHPPRLRCSAPLNDDIITRRGKDNRTSPKVAAARRLLTLVFYGMRDGQIRRLSRRQDPPPARAARAVPVEGCLNDPGHHHVDVIIPRHQYTMTNCAQERSAGEHILGS